jgi:hypothetical protein
MVEEVRPRIADRGWILIEDLRRQQGNGEVPPAEFTKNLEFLPEIGERDRGLSPSVVEPAGEEEKRRLRIERELAGLHARGEVTHLVHGKLLRYQIRMSTRPTPYGMFAGVVLGAFGQSTTIALDDTNPVWRARPDMEWLLSFVGALEARPEVRRQLRIVAHPAVFARTGRVFLSDPTPLQDATDSAIVSVRESRAVSSALARARSYVPYSQLAEDLRDELEVEREKVDQLLTELWRQGLLLTDLRPPLTLASPAAYVTERLESLPAPPPETGALRTALDALGMWDHLPPADAAMGWPALKTKLTKLHGGGESSSGQRYEITKFRLACRPVCRSIVPSRSTSSPWACTTDDFDCVGAAPT